MNGKNKKFIFSKKYFENLKDCSINSDGEYFLKEPINLNSYLIIDYNPNG